MRDRRTADDDPRPPRVRRWLIPEPAMGRRRWPVPEITSVGALAGFLGVSDGELAWFADARGLERTVAGRTAPALRVRVPGPAREAGAGDRAAEAAAEGHAAADAARDARLDPGARGGARLHARSVGTQPHKRAHRAIRRHPSGPRGLLRLDRRQPRLRHLPNGRLPGIGGPFAHGADARTSSRRSCGRRFRALPTLARSTRIIALAGGWQRRIYRKGLRPRRRSRTSPRSDSTGASPGSRHRSRSATRATRMTSPSLARRDSSGSRTHCGGPSPRSPARRGSLSTTTSRCSRPELADSASAGSSSTSASTLRATSTTSSRRSCTTRACMGRHRRTMDPCRTSERTCSDASRGSNR